MKLKPLGTRVVVQLIPKPGQTATGIHTPGGGDDGPATYKIIGVGDGVTRLKAGDIGLASKFAGMNVGIDDTVRLLLEDEIVGLIYPDEWTLHVLPYGIMDFAADVIAPIPAAATAIVSLTAEGGVILSPYAVPLPKEAVSALYAHEYVRVVAEKANDDGGRDLVVLFKVQTAALLKNPAEFNARAIKDGEFGFGRWERIPVDGGGNIYASATTPTYEECPSECAAEGEIDLNI